MVGLAIRLKLVEVPIEAQNVPIGKHRGVGRPSKVPNSSCYLGETQNASQFVKPDDRNDSISELDDLVVDSQLALAESQLTMVQTQVNYLETLDIPEPEVDLAETPQETIVIRKRGRPTGSKNKAKKAK